MAYELAFVDSISASPTTRLNLHDGVAISTLADETDFGLPTLDRAYADTLLADGAVVPAAAYGNRIITLALDFNGASSDQAALRFQSVVRELDRPTNLLRYKPGTSNPVFFRTLRSDVAGWDFNPLTARATVRVLAEPFAYGTKQTLSAATVTNDPAAGTNGQFFDVTGVLGDVETPLMLSIPASGLLPGGSSATGLTSCIAVRRRGTPSAAPFLVQAESLSLATDTTLPGADAAMSGSGSNYARVSFATDPSLIVRLSTASTSWVAASRDVRGTYRVLARTRKSVAGDTIQLQLRYNANGLTVTNTAATLSSSTNIRYSDLGLITLPAGADPVYDLLSGTELPAVAANFSILASRGAGGSGNLDLDFLLFVPADDCLALVTWGRSGGPDTYVLDSSIPAAYSMLSGAVYSDPPMSIVGGVPMVSPNVTNRVYFVRNVNTTDTTTDSKASTNAVTASYFPRYLAVRPLAS